MTSKLKLAGAGVAVVVVIAAIAYVFTTPYNRTPGVRLGGTETAAPADWRTVDNGPLMQIKPAGFPPLVINIWYVGTAEGVISATRPDNGYWGNRMRANSNGWIRIGDAAYEMQAEEILNPTDRNRMLQAYVDKYNLESVPGMNYAALTDPDLPWEVFLWTAR